MKDGDGKLIAELHPGNSLTFAPFAKAQPGTSAKPITASGVLLQENGKLYLQETDNIRYELKGNLPAKLVGKKVVVRGVVQAQEDGSSAIEVSAIAEAGKAGGMGASTKWIIVGAVAAGATIPIVYYSTHSSTPASR